jgi:hypothetical protein
MPEKPNSFVQVNTATTPGKKLAMYEFPDDEAGDGSVLQSEAVTLTTGQGEQLLGLQHPSRSIPVVVADQPEKLHNGEEKIVGEKAVKLLDENHRRLTALVQNTGDANIRVGARGVTAKTGLRLVPNAVEIFTVPDVYKGEVWAIREGAVDSVAFSQETTATVHRRHVHDEHDEHEFHEEEDDGHEHGPH